MIAFAFLTTSILFVVDDVAADDLTVLLEVYASDVKDLRLREVTPVERQRFREDWLARFLHGLAENPSSPSYRMVIAKAVGLANSLGDWGTSKSLSAELVQTGTSNEDAVFWLIEQGEASVNAYRTTSDPAQLDNAISNLTKALSLASRENSEVAPDVRAKAVVGGVLLASSLAEFGRGSEKEVGDLLDSLSRLSSRLPPDVAKRLQKSGYGPERLAAARLTAAVSLSSSAMADKALEQLLTLSDAGALAAPFSSYLLRFARASWPQKGAVFRDFLIKWAARSGQDPSRVHVYFAIMASAHADRSCDEVMEYGELILGESGEILRNPDLAGADDSTAYMSEVYGMMAECSALSGKQAEAGQYKAALKELAPDDRRLRKLNSSSNLALQSPAKRSVHWLVWANLVAFVVLCVWFVTLRIRNFRDVR